MSPDTASLDTATGLRCVPSRPRISFASPSCLHSVVFTRPGKRGPITTGSSLAKDAVTTGLPQSGITRYGSRVCASLARDDNGESSVLVAFQLQHPRSLPDLHSPR